MGFGYNEKGSVYEGREIIGEMRACHHRYTCRERTQRDVDGAEVDTEGYIN